MSVTFSRSLSRFFEGSAKILQSTMISFANAIDRRLIALEQQKATVDGVVSDLKLFAFERVQEAVLPAYQVVTRMQEKGWLVARSSSTASIAIGGTVVLVIDDDDTRATFTPTPIVWMAHVSDPDNRALIQRVDYNASTGQFVGIVIATWGDAGPHDDWELSGAAASSISAIDAEQGAISARDLSRDWAEKASGDVDGAGTRSAKFHASAAAASATAASGSAAAALASAGVADGRADDADASASFAADKADEAAASALAAATSAASVDGPAIDIRLDALEAAMPTKAPQATTYTKDETDARIEAAGGQILAWMKFKQVETL